MSKPKEFQESDYSNDGSNIVFKRQRKYHWISMSIISYQIPKNPGFAVYEAPIVGQRRENLIVRVKFESVEP
jgi:hypothetical protein